MDFAAFHEREHKAKRGKGNHGQIAADLSAALEHIAALERTLVRRDKQIVTTRKAWVRAARAALAAIHGASNSTHPAHDLWLRVEMADLPPMSVVLSEDAASNGARLAGEYDGEQG